MNESVITILQVMTLALVAASATAVVFTRQPAHQMVGVSFFGLILALMFLLFQAADVALSQIVIGAVALPLMVMLALGKIRRQSIEADDKEHGE